MNYVSCFNFLRMGSVLFVFLLWSCEDESLFSLSSKDASIEKNNAFDAQNNDVMHIGQDRIPPDDVRDAGIVDTKIDPNLPSAPIYIHTSTMLYSYDPDDNQAERIGVFHTETEEFSEKNAEKQQLVMADIAIDFEGNLFGAAYLGDTVADPDKNFSGIYKIDPHTAFCMLVGKYNGLVTGLAVLPNGKLVAAETKYFVRLTNGERESRGTNRVTVLDPKTGNLENTLVADGSGFETSGDIVGLPDGKLYWTVLGAANHPEQGDGLVQIDPINGSLKFLGSIGVNNLFGVAYASGVIYAVQDGGKIFQLEPSTGNILKSSNLPGQWWGATTNPVSW